MTAFVNCNRVFIWSIRYKSYGNDLYYLLLVTFACEQTRHNFPLCPEVDETDDFPLGANPRYGLDGWSAKRSVAFCLHVVCQLWGLRKRKPHD